MDNDPGNGGSSRVSRLPEPLRIGLSLLLDYLRWVSLTPMVVVWAFYLFTILFMLFVNFQDSIMETLESGYESYRESYGPIAWLEEDPAAQGQEQSADGQQEPGTSSGDPSANGAVEFDGSDVMPWIMQGWGIIALVAWVLSLVRGFVFGPRPPRTLVQKRRMLFVAVLVGWLLLFVAYFFGSTTSQGSFLQWFAMFTGAAIIVLVVSLPTLMLGELFSSLRDRLESGRAPPSDPSTPA